MVFRLGWEVPCVFFGSGHWFLLTKKLCVISEVQICMTIKLLQIVGGAQQLAVVSWVLEGNTLPFQEIVGKISINLLHHRIPPKVLFSCTSFARYWSRTWACTDSNYFTYCKQHSQTPLLLKSILHNIPIFLTTKQTGSILVPKTWRHIRPIIYTMTLCL